MKFIKHDNIAINFDLVQSVEKSDYNSLLVTFSDDELMLEFDDHQSRDEFFDNLCGF